MKDWLIKLIPLAWKEYFGKRTYTLKYTIEYKSMRYGKTRTVEKGYKSDGATGAFDIYSEAWWVHDKLCETGKWDDGSPVKALQAASVLADILRSDGRPIRAFLWKWATLLFGCAKARANGWV